MSKRNATVKRAKQQEASNETTKISGEDEGLVDGQQDPENKPKRPRKNNQAKTKKAGAAGKSQLQPDEDSSKTVVKKAGKDKKISEKESTNVAGEVTAEDAAISSTSAEENQKKVVPRKGNAKKQIASKKPKLETSSLPNEQAPSVKRNKVTKKEEELHNVPSDDDFEMATVNKSIDSKEGTSKPVPKNKKPAGKKMPEKAEKKVSKKEETQTSKKGEKESPEKKDTPPNRSVLQLKVSLKGISPPIWRRIQVLNNNTFFDLNNHIMEAMGWAGNHSSHFIVKNPKTKSNIRIVSSMFEKERNLFDQRKIKLSKFLNQKGDSILFEYDLGDSWIHEIKIESILPPPPPKAEYPKIKAGKRACPPEDCGGVCGYMHLLEVSKDPSHEEYQELIVKWLGELNPNWDPEKFDKKKIFKKVWMWLPAQ